MGPLVKEGFFGLGRHDMNHVYHMLDYETRCSLTPLSCPLFGNQKMGSTANKGNFQKFEKEPVTRMLKNITPSYSKYYFIYFNKSLYNIFNIKSFILIFYILN